MFCNFHQRFWEETFLFVLCRQKEQVRNRLTEYYQYKYLTHQ